MDNQDISAKYVKVLEDYHKLSQEHRTLQEQFNAEYNFAQDKVEKIEMFEKFINSGEDIKDKYEEFKQNLLPKEE